MPLDLTQERAPRSWLFTPTHAMLDFAAFVDEAEAYEDFCQRWHEEVPDHAPCLFDLVECWLMDGNARELCPTYEMFLQVVITIMNDVLLEDANTITGIELWSYRDDTGRPQKVEVLCQRINGEPGECYQHPIMNKTLFEFTRVSDASIASPQRQRHTRSAR